MAGGPRGKGRGGGEHGTPCRRFQIGRSSILNGFLLARLAYVGVILLATLSGIEADFDAARMRERLSRALDLDLRARDAVDAARNLVLFAGWGAVWLVTAPGTRLPRRILEATLTGAALSVLVETMQLASSTRVTSIVDVATNTGGAFAGASFIVVLAWTVHRRRGARSFVGIPALLFAAWYGAAVALEAFIPLFESGTFLPTTEGGFLARLAHALEHFDWASFRRLPLLHLLLFPPAGAFAVAALVESGAEYRHAWRRVAAFAAPLIVLVELLGGAAGYPIVAGAAITNIVAVTLGAWAAARWLPALTRWLRGRTRPLALLAAYAGVLVLWSWRPFVPETSLSAFLEQLSWDRLRPLAAHAMRFDLFSAVDLLRQFSLLIPVGALLAVWPLRKRGWLRGPLPGIYAAVLLEVGQLLWAARMFDVTDALVGVAAVLIGWIVVRRSGFGMYGEALPPTAPTRAAAERRRRGAARRR